MLPASSEAITSPLPRIIVYHQTHRHEGQPISILPLLTQRTAVTHVIVAAIHLNTAFGDITLNDDPYHHPKNEILWQEVVALQSAGIKVLGMLGGAAKGTFTRLDQDNQTFEAYYMPLRQMITDTGLDGLDLDVEEEMSLAGIIRLIDRLRTDFRANFIITLAPVATALQSKRHISGFDYVQLEKAFGHKIDWYNTQFYCGWGSMESTQAYDEIIRQGWHAEKVVVGLITNPESEIGWVEDDQIRDTLEALTRKYPQFGGVMGWEYFNSITVAEPFGWPWSWANLMTDVLRRCDPVGFDEARLGAGPGLRAALTSVTSSEREPQTFIASETQRENPFAAVFKAEDYATHSVSSQLKGVKRSHSTIIPLDLCCGRPHQSTLSPQHVERPETC